LMWNLASFGMQDDGVERAHRHRAARAPALRRSVGGSRGEPSGLARGGRPALPGTRAGHPRHPRVPTRGARCYDRCRRPSASCHPRRPGGGQRRRPPCDDRCDDRPRPAQIGWPPPTARSKRVDRPGAWVSRSAGEARPNQAESSAPRRQRRAAPSGAARARDRRRRAGSAR
jgi:hypothetical protein